MMEFRKFDSNDLIALNLQEFQKHVEAVITADDEHGKLCMISKLAWTGLWDGKIIGAAGILKQDTHKGQCWMVFAENIPMRAWPIIVRKTRMVLEEAHKLGMVRLWATVIVGHEAGERFIKKLGFEEEGLMKNDGPNLEHQILYAKINLGSK